MDAARGAAYVLAAMNLLLLLSALLSALTGVGSSTRVAEPARAVATIGVGRANASILAPAHSARRPIDALPALRTIAASEIVVPALVHVAPLWIDRRRE